LSYWERIEKAVPIEFVQLGVLPPKPAIVSPFGPSGAANPTDSAPVRCKESAKSNYLLIAVCFAQLNPIYSHPVAKELVGKLKARQPVEDVLSKALANSVNEVDDSITRIELIQIMTRALMLMGSKSHTHMQVVLDRYKSALHHLAYNAAGVPVPSTTDSMDIEQPAKGTMVITGSCKETNCLP